jgi:hypothetical protein
LHQHHQAIGEREKFEKAQELPTELKDFSPTNVAELHACAAPTPAL